MNRIATNLVLTVAALVVAVNATGCSTTNWPYGMSRDRHNYVSTPDLPVTVTLMDVLTEEQLLVIDVPVGWTLVMDLDQPETWTATQTASTPANRVDWSLIPTGRRFEARWQNGMDLPGNPVIIKPTYRDPEPMGTGVAQTGPRTGQATPKTTAQPARSQAKPSPSTKQPAKPTVPIQRETKPANPPSSPLGASDSPVQEDPRGTQPQDEPQAEPEPDEGKLEDALE